MTTGEPGSAARAFLGWRATASALLFVWAVVPFGWRLILKDPEGFEDLAFVLLAVFAYVAAIFVIIPAFAFTLGRWIDRRTAPRGLVRSLISFGIWGLGFGLVLVLLVGLGALTPVGIAVLLLAPVLAAVGGRLLVELRGRGWAIALWVTFTLAVLAALSLIGTIALSAAFQK